MTDWKQAFERGVAAGGTGDLATAERAFREAATLAPDEAYPHYELGYTLSLMGRFADALVELRRTSALQRGFFLVDTEIYLCEQVLARALDRDMLIALRKVIARVGNDEATTLETEALCRAIVANAPGCALGHFFLGKCVLERLPDEAEAALTTCLTLAPDDTTAIDARYHLGVLRRLAGAPTDARAIWEQIERDYPDHPYASIARVNAE